MVARFKPKVTFLMGLQNKRKHPLQVKRCPLAPSSLPGGFSHFFLINKYISSFQEENKRNHTFFCLCLRMAERKTWDSWLIALFEDWGGHLLGVLYPIDIEMRDDVRSFCVFVALLVDK